MAYRTLELTLISANDLKQVTPSSKMEVYAISSIDGYRSSQQSSPADREGGTSPVWNTTLRFSIPTGDPSNHFLHVLLRCHHDLGDLDIGEIRIRLKELLNSFAAGEGDRKFVRCQLRNLPCKADEPAKALRDGEPVTGNSNAATPSTRATYPRVTPPYANTSPPPGYGNLESDPAGKNGGVVYLSYKFLDAAPLRADEPVTAYRHTSDPSSRALGAPPYAQLYRPPAGYGQPPAGYGYFPAGGAPPFAQTYRPPAGYGYPMPAPTGYGYPPAGGVPPYAQPYLSPAGYAYPAPAPAGYGYPPVGNGYGATHSSWNMFGSGMELLSGALGVGVLIGNILSDGSGGGGGGSYSHGGGHSHGWGGSGGGGGSYSDGGGYSHGWGGSGGGGGSYSDGGGYNDGWGAGWSGSGDGDGGGGGGGGGDSDGLGF